MYYFVVDKWSVGMQFHLYRGFDVHAYSMFGVERWALQLGGFTLDFVKVEEVD